MATETVTPEAEVAAATNGESAQPEATQQEGRPRERRQHTPPEELYDLTKPIPREDKPSKEAHDEEVEAINASIDSLKEEKNTVQKKIEEALDGNRNSAAGQERDALHTLRKKKGSLIAEKKKMRARLDLAKKQADGLLNDRKAAKANIRFSSVADIEKEVSKLKSRQETTSMSLGEEKKLIKEIDNLQKSKALVAQIKDKDANIDNVMEQRKLVLAELKEKDAEIDAVEEEIKGKQKIVDELSESQKELRSGLDVLKLERDHLRKEIGEKMDERNKVRDTFREANNKWYDYQRAIKAQKKIKYEEEKKKREDEKLAWIAAKEAEEAKKIPYEEEMHLCDYIAEYLERTYLSDGKKTEVEAKKENVLSDENNFFANAKPRQRKEEETFLQVGKGKKKPRVRASKKKAVPVFKLNVESFEQFGMLGLTPPTNLESVQKSVDDLKAKKEWYSQQERGSVPTASETRKANEKAAEKLRQKPEASTAKKNTKLDISSDDFAPLTTSSSTAAMNATWGQKAVEEDVAVVEETSEVVSEVVEVEASA